MIDHIGIRTADPARCIGFYEAALRPLGIEKKVDYPGGAGFGRGEQLAFWIGESAAAPSSAHIAFAAPDRAAVTAFHRAALAAGGKDNGAPGLRPDYHADYFAAFVIDPDGNNVEAVCHTSG